MGAPLAESAGRVAGGFGIVACAVVVALAAGGSSLFGGLGGLFGARGDSLEVAERGGFDRGIVAGPTAAERAAAVARLNGGSEGRRDRPGDGRRDARRPESSPRDPGGPGPQTLPPVDAPPPPGGTPAPDLPPPAPPPGNGQVVTLVGETLKQVTRQIPSEAQPLVRPVEDTVDTLIQTCGSLPLCP